MVRLRLALVQVRVDNSPAQTLASRLKHLDALLDEANVKRGDVDLVCFPEACCSPYLFESPQDAERRAEPERQRDVALEWVKATARRLDCGVAAGLILSDAEAEAETGARPRNAYVVVSPQGDVLTEQSKIFLYPTDEVWAAYPHPHEAAFRVVDLPWLGAGNARMIVGVCNDINSSGANDFFAYPLASAGKKQHANIVCLLTAWCSAGPFDPPAAHDEPVEPSAQLKYWLARLEPMLGTGAVFIAADRVGRETIPANVGAGGGRARIRYCGSSCCIQLSPNQPRLLGNLDTENEGVLRAQVELPPVVSPSFTESDSDA